MPGGFTATASRLLQRPVGPSRGRRTSTATSTATARTTNDLLYIPAAADRSHVTRTAPSRICCTFINAKTCLADYIGQDHTSATRAARRGSTRSTCASTSACRSSACKAEITLDILNLINLFDARRAVPVRELQRPARRRADIPGGRPGNYNLANSSRTACCRRRGAVHAQRPAVALADAVGGENPVLGRVLRFSGLRF